MKQIDGLEITRAEEFKCGCGGSCDCSGDNSTGTTLTEAIQQRYSAVALRGTASEQTDAACCKSASALYADSDLQAVTPQAASASAGCGNPVGLAEVNEGETVLDLGSGGGIDCFLAAKATGPDGRIYGVDMTPEMLKLARENAERLGAQNVTFLLGKIEAVPLPDSSIDLVISNCVIALAPDKQRVFDEIFRLLRPGGRFVISDVVSTTELPETAQQNLAEWVACVGGAELMSRYLERIQETGFNRIEVVTDTAFSSTGSGRDPWRGSLRSVTVKAFKDSEE